MTTKDYEEAYEQGKRDAVKHGHWVDATKEVGWPEVRCSVCGKIGRGDYLVCPWCGARMDDAPTIDAVPVVRCRDCKWYKTMYCKMDRWTDCVTVYVAKKDDYCSYGERR